MECCGSGFIYSGFGMGFRYWSGSSILGLIPIRIQDFDDQKLIKNYSWNFFIYLFDQKLQFTYPYTSIKDVPGTGEAFRRTPALQRNFVIFSIIFGSFLPSWIRIRIPNPEPLTWLNPDPIRIRNTAVVWDVSYHFILTRVKFWRQISLILIGL